MTGPDHPSSGSDDEIARQVEVARRWARMLNESRVSLDETRREVFKAVEALISARFELAETSAALGDQVSTSVLGRLAAAEARFSELTSTHSVAIAEHLRNAASTGAAQLAEAAEAVRSAESSFAGGAELLKTYADTYRVVWLRAAEGMAKDVERQWEAMGAEQRQLTTDVRAWLPVIEEAQQQAATHAEVLAGYAKRIQKLEADIRTPITEAVMPVRRTLRLVVVLSVLQALALLGFAVYGVISTS